MLNFDVFFTFSAIFIVKIDENCDDFLAFGALRQPLREKKTSYLQFTV